MTTGSTWIYNQLRHGVDFDKDYKAIVRNITAADIQRIARNLIKSNAVLK